MIDAYDIDRGCTIRINVAEAGLFLVEQDHSFGRHLWESSATGRQYSIKARDLPLHHAVEVYSV